MSRDAVRRVIISSPQDVLRRIGGGITPLNVAGAATESTTSGVDDRRGRSSSVGMLSFKLSVRFGGEAEFNLSVAHFLSP